MSNCHTLSKWGKATRRSLRAEYASDFYGEVLVRLSGNSALWGALAPPSYKGVATLSTSTREVIKNRKTQPLSPPILYEIDKKR